MKSARRDSRTRILDAARRTFAARGYTGAGVDHIARLARVNKAMIYYHFASKQTLYRTVLQELFTALADHLRAVLDRPDPPAVRLDRLIAAIAAFVQERPYFPRIMLREIAEGGTRLDQETLRLMSALPQVTAAIIAQGRTDGTFRDVHPLLTYFSVMGPIVMFLGSAPIREQFAQRLLVPGAGVDPDAFIGHLQEFVQRGVAAGAAARAASAAAPPRRRTTV